MISLWSKKTNAAVSKMEPYSESNQWSHPATSTWLSLMEDTRDWTWNLLGARQKTAVAWNRRLQLVLRASKRDLPLIKSGLRLAPPPYLALFQSYSIPCHNLLHPTQYMRNFGDGPKCLSLLFLGRNQDTLFSHSNPRG